MNCQHDNVANFDTRGMGDGPMTNRVCLTCKQHWHGLNGEVREYARAEWDVFANQVES